MSERNYWNRMRRNKMSRRSLLRASARAGVGAAGIALVGCGDDDDDQAVTQVQQQQQQQPQQTAQPQQQQQQQADAQAQQADQQDESDAEQQAQQDDQQQAAQAQAQAQAQQVAVGRVGELNVPDLSGSFSQLDPVTGSGGNDHQHLWVGHDNLVGYDTELVPDTSRSLAEGWEVSDDGLKIIFTIRPNVTFHDGEPLNAEAVKIHTLRARDLPEGNTGADVQFIDSVDTPDELTAVFNMKQPFAPLLRILGDRAGMVVSPKAIEEKDVYLDRSPVGAGAFKFVEEVVDDRMVFEAFEDYWQPGHPKVNKIVWHLGRTSDQAINGMIAGEYNAQFSPDSAQVDRLTDAGLAYETRPTNWTQRYWLNMRIEPWTNPHLRRAINWGIDKQSLLDVVWNGQGIPVHWGWLGPATGPDHDPDYQGYIYNPDKVREELALAGHPDGFEFEMNTFSGAQAIAHDEFIAASLAQFGIIAKLNPKPSPAFWREFWDLEVSGHSSSMSVRADVWQQLAFVHDPLSQSRNVVPEDENDPDRKELVRLLGEVGAEFDPELRFVKIQELNRAMDTAAWGVNFFHHFARTAHAANVSFPLFADAKPHWGQGDVTITA